MFCTTLSKWVPYLTAESGMIMVNSFTSYYSNIYFVNEEIRYVRLLDKSNEYNLSCV